MSAMVNNRGLLKRPRTPVRLVEASSSLRVASAPTSSEFMVIGKDKQRQVWRGHLLRCLHEEIKNRSPSPRGIRRNKAEEDHVGM